VNEQIRADYKTEHEQLQSQINEAHTACEAAMAQRDMAGVVKFGQQEAEMIAKRDALRSKRDEELAANMEAYKELASRVAKNIAGQETKAADAQGGSKQPRREPPQLPPVAQAAMELAKRRMAERRLAEQQGASSSAAE
jgi:hypothetical protein